MVLITGCPGLRVSEIVALQWWDFDFPGRTLLIQRSVVHGRVGDVKTEYSRDSVPLDTAVVVRQSCHGKAVPPGGDSEEAHSQGWCRIRDRRQYRLAYVQAPLSVVVG